MDSLRIVLCLAALLSCQFFRANQAADAVETNPNSFALLIGINEYPNLPAKRQLKGCINDVRLVRHVLVTHAGFPNSNVTTLIDSLATRESILNQLERLKQSVRRCNESGRAARIVLHFSGHGAQVMDQLSGPFRDEPTYFDQTIVPYDAQQTGGESDIRDDALNQWASEICQFDGNRLFVVLDCCHSGTGLRRLSRYRRLDRTLPKPDADDFAPIAQSKSLPPNVAVISACKSDQLEPEYSLGDQSHGLLTFWICRIAEENARRDATKPGRFALQDLPQILRAKYLNDGEVLLPPMPQLESSGKMAFGDLLFVPSNTVGPNTAILKVSEGGKSKLMRGQLDNVKAGQTYEVFSNISLEKSHRIGTFVPDKVGAASTTGTTQLDDREFAPGRFETRTYFCKVGDASDIKPIKIQLSADIGGATGRTLSVDEILESESVPTDQFIQYQSSPEGASYRLLVTPKELHFESIATSSEKQLIRSTRGRPIVSIQRDATLRQRFSKFVRQLVAIDKLQTLVVENAANPSITSRQMSVQLRKGDIVDGQYSFASATVNADGIPHLRTGDVYNINVMHSRSSEQDVYVTIAHIDPQFDLALMCPQTFSSSDFSEQLISGDKGLSTRAFICNGDASRDQDDPDFAPGYSGLHHAIVIASSEPTDLSNLFGFVEGSSSSDDSQQDKAGHASKNIEIGIQKSSKSRLPKTRRLKKLNQEWLDAVILTWASET